MEANQTNKTNPNLGLWPLVLKNTQSITTQSIQTKNHNDILQEESQWFSSGKDVVIFHKQNRNDILQAELHTHS